MSDQITVKMDPNQKAFTPCPAGTHHAVCVDIVDMGESVEQFQDQPAHLVQKAVLVFQTDEESPDTHKRHEVSIEFTVATEYERGEGLKATFGPKSKIRKMLGGWRGKPYTDEEAKESGAPLHKLVGVNAVLNVIHKTSKQDKVYAVIDSISPPLKSLPKLVAHEYERSAWWGKKRSEQAEKVAQFKAASPAKSTGSLDDFPEALNAEDDDLPF